MEIRSSLTDLTTKLPYATTKPIPSQAAPVDEAQAESCVICLGKLVAPCEAQPCGHTNFDYICLLTWLEFRPTCPLCQSGVHEVRHSDEDGGHRKPGIYKVPESSAQSQNFNGSCSEPERNQEPLEDEGLRRRRSIYRQNLYALHVGSNRRQPGESQYTELTPRLFLADPELVSRARMWLQRELRVFRFLYADVVDPETIDLARPSKAEFVREYIIFTLKSVDIQDHAGEAEEAIRRFLGRENTQHLLHELKAWLRSPCKSLEEWDRIVQYRVDLVPR